MFEGVGIKPRIGENMKDNEEIETLLGEIPHVTSPNHHSLLRSQSQSSGYGVHVHGGDSSSVRQTVRRGGPMFGEHDDVDGQYKYRCSSPVSGFSLPSDGSSSSLLSSRHSFSDHGSPTSPPLEEPKSLMQGGRSPHHNGMLLDSRSPNSTSGKNPHENLINELNLSANLGRMCIEDSLPVDWNDIWLYDQMRAANRLNSEGYGANRDYYRGYSDYGSGLSSNLRSPMGLEGDILSALSKLQDKHRMGNLGSSLHSNGGGYGLFTEKSYPNSNYYQRKTPPSMLPRSSSQVPLYDALLYSQKYGMNLEGDRGRFCTSDVNRLGQQSPYMDGESMLDYSPPITNGRGGIPSNSNGRISRNRLGSLTSEESLIIQEDAFRSGLGNQRERNGDNCFSSKYGGKRMDFKFAGIGENAGTDRRFSSTTTIPKFNTLEEAQGYIHLLAKDQHGCRFLQKIFEEGNSESIQKIFDEIIYHVVELMTNPFGNYLMQKLLDICSEEQRMQILLMLTKVPGQLVRVSLNTHGTRVVQKLIETIKTRQQIELVISALEPAFLALIKDLNGNHVVQRCLQCLSKEDNEFIFVAAARYCVDIASHQHGCCVLQRCISFSTGELRDELIGEICANALMLAQDTYGNYVIQFIVEQKIPSASSALISEFEGNFVHLASQKFSSHVIEKCLAVFDDEMRSRVVHELLSASNFDQLLQDPHANYVIQAALRYTKGYLHSLLVDTIESYKAISRNSPYSKRIFSQISKR